VLLLLVLYGLFAAITRSPYEILSDIALGLVIFGFLLLFYLKNVIGGGDVKLVPVAALFVGTQSALPFAILLLVFTSLHLFATRMGWASTLAVGDKRAISYAPSVAAALICIIVLDCL
jgi:Flp pilus assembly protein protease CpaA